jgi:hypothetical protein
MAETTPTAWQSKLVAVPVWSLMLLGAAMVGGGGIAGFTATKAEAAEVIQPADIAEMRAYLVRIDGRLEGIERDNATMRSELVSLRRDVNTLRADVDALQRGH